MKSSGVLDNRTHNEDHAKGKVWITKQFTYDEHDV